MIFSLDIGTRSVVGMVGYQDGDDYVVLDYEQVHHQVNAMRDGQIEDIELVAGAVKTVRDALEKRSGVKFKSAAIAAAGRALKTVTASYSRELDESEEITHSMIESLEYSVVDAAQQRFLEQKQKGGDEFFCVGYSVITYKLDDYVYANLEGHRGRTVELEAVAAFLPNHVVESLYAVTSKNHLDVANLTLEPIAAIHVIVPRDIRLLNIAIVDIGAGTSDIAVSKNGSIVAYGMATVAGDEITEAIMKRFLAGFDASEKLKIAWANGDAELKVEDIFGTVRPVSAEEIESACGDVIQTLGGTVAKDILSINGDPPMGVFLVGGGSQTPGLCRVIAGELGMPEERVAVGGRQPFKQIRLPSAALINPEFVTPIGIGVVCSLFRGCNFFAVTVNGKNIMAINNGDIRVMDALLLAGIKPSRLIGFSSSGISYTLNGSPVHLRGNPAEPGQILLNGEIASIQTPIQPGDTIAVTAAVDGKPPQPSVGEALMRETPVRYVIDGAVVTVRNTAFVNGKKVKASYLLSDGDALLTDAPRTVREIYENLDVPAPANVIYLINGEEGALTASVSPGDVIETVEKPITNADESAQKPPENRDAEEREEAVPEWRSPMEELSGEPVPVRGHTATITLPQPVGEVANVCINGVWHKVSANHPGGLIFVDMLNFVDIDTDRPEGVLRMRINGREASYVDNVTGGDNVEIFWEG